jgi:Uma2 family endonuclease
MVDAADLLARQVRRLSVAEYHLMIDAHILGGDDRVELLEGLVVTMSPQKPPHAVVIERLSDALFLGLDVSRYRIRCQLPLTLADSEPEPDVVILSRDVANHRTHPRTAPLVFEVSGDSLRRDRQVKARLYARAGVFEYVIADVEARRLEVFRSPEPASASYRRSEVLTGADGFRSESVPGIAFDVARLFEMVD